MSFEFGSMNLEGNVNSSYAEAATVGPYISGRPLRKGPWNSAEDAALIEYIRSHGAGNWNAVHRVTGLDRCGKSCRLRWINHLSPSLKKGPFSPEEEQSVVELHAILGNKWAQISAEIPGRSDNEIKNFWHTRTKKRQRVGLPIYPPHLDFQNSNSTSLDPGWAKKPELPSFQNQLDPPPSSLHNQISSWEFDPPLSPLPSLDSVNTFNWSLPTEVSGSGNVSSVNSGLLDSVLYESQTLSLPENNFFQQTCSASMVPGDMVNSQFPDFDDTEWGRGYLDPISPFGHSDASVLTEHTPINASPLEGHQSEGWKLAEEYAQPDQIQRNDGENDTPHQVFPELDFLLDPDRVFY